MSEDNYSDENIEGHSASLQLCSWLITPATTTPAAPFFLASAQPGGHRAGSLGAVGRSTRVCDGAGQRCRTGLATFRRGGSWLSAGRRRHTTPIQRWFGLAGEQRPQGPQRGAARGIRGEAHGCVDAGIRVGVVAIGAVQPEFRGI